MINLNHDYDDYALERYLLNGKQPRYRRADRHTEKRESPVTDPDTLEPYERLIHEQNSRLTKEQCTLRAFEWAMDGISYDDAAVWFAGGASLWDKQIIMRFNSVGIPPQLALREVLRFGKPTGRSFFAMVSSGEMTVEVVREIISRQVRKSS